MNEGLERVITEHFHTMYYWSPHTWNNGYTRFMGNLMFQMPFDLWIMQEILWETKPDVFIETGTYLGGSALYYAVLMDYMKKGRIITIDNEVRENRPKHKRITYLNGMSTDKDIFEKVTSSIKEGEKVMVTLDSDHSMENVFKEMELYGPIVSKNCYMVVQDTNLGKNPIDNAAVPGLGPMGAVDKYLKKHKDFVIDLSREKYYLTFFPNGWLVKIK